MFRAPNGTVISDVLGHGSTQDGDTGNEDNSFAGLQPCDDGSYFTSVDPYQKSISISRQSISKLLEMINKSTYILACSTATALDLDMNQTACSDGHPSM